MLLIIVFLFRLQKAMSTRKSSCRIFNILDTWVVLNIVMLQHLNIRSSPIISRSILIWYCTEIHYNDVIMSPLASQITSLAIVYSTVYSVADQRKHQSFVSLAFVRGIHRGPVNSPHKWSITRKMFPFDDVIMNMYSTWVDIWTHNRHPMVHPWGRAIGCLLWAFCRMLTVLAVWCEAMTWHSRDVIALDKTLNSEYSPKYPP